MHAARLQYVEFLANSLQVAAGRLTPLSRVKNMSILKKKTEERKMIDYLINNNGGMVFAIIGMGIATIFLELVQQRVLEWQGKQLRRWQRINLRNLGRHWFYSYCQELRFVWFCDCLYDLRQFGSRDVDGDRNGLFDGFIAGSFYRIVLWDRTRKSGRIRDSNLS